MVHIKTLIVLTVAAGMLGLSGCGGGGDSNVGAVSGTISVDGKPIGGATVSFYPVQGRASLGVTDENGAYTLTYVRNQKGALVGKHEVTVKTIITSSSGYGYEDKSKAAPRKEMLPEKYWKRQKTELTATVEKGNNTIDFDLESK